MRATGVAAASRPEITEPVPESVIEKLLPAVAEPNVALAAYGRSVPPPRVKFTVPVELSRDIELRASSPARRLTVAVEPVVLESLVANRPAPLNPIRAVDPSIVSVPVPPRLPSTRLPPAAVAISEPAVMVYVPAA